jgi:hypothetical protein
MNTPRKTAQPSENTPARKAGTRKPAARTDLQPPATGAHRGSPAAPSMKQFAKTRAESSGRS